MRRHRVAAAIAIVAMVAASQLSAQQRSQAASDADLARISERLEAVIADLDRDQHDYGGHKGKAVQFLRQARQELHAAQDSARSNGR